MNQRKEFVLSLLVPFLSFVRNFIKQLFIKFFYRISGFINVLELVNQTLGMNFHYARHPYKSPSLGDSLSFHDDSVILHERRPHVIEDQGGGEIGVIAATVPVLNTQKKEKEKVSNYVA